MAGEIKLSGLASGIGFDEIVSKMIEAEKYQANKLESWKRTWQSKVDALRELSSRVSSLQSTNNILKKASSFLTRYATTTNNNVADIAVDSSSIVGSYKMEVATTVKHKTASRGVDSLLDDIAPSGGTLTFDDGSGNDITVVLTAGMNLEQLKDAINLASPSAKADIIDTGSQTDRYRLVITSAVAGQNGHITFGTDSTNLLFGEKSYSESFESSNIANISDYLKPSGTYTGHTSKRINFTVETSGDVSSGDVRLRYEDPSDGRSGVITISGIGTVTLFQGLSIDFLNDISLTKGDKFSLDVFAPDIQLGQDKGLAQTAQVTHAGLASRTDFVTTTAGTFQYSYGGIESQTINVPENTTLEQFVKLINESPGNPGVRASIINDGSGTAQAYHLIITGIDSGAAKQVEIIDSTLTGIDKSDFMVTRKATNAIIKIDDYPPGSDNWIQQSSNLITDMLEGASIRLKDSGVVTFNISNNDDDMADKVQAFVDEYNALLDYIDEITKVVLNESGESEIGKAGILVGNYAVNILRGNLRTFIGERAKGFNSDNDMYSLLTQVGLKSNHDTQRMEFDRDTFKNELNSNADAIIKLFSADNDGSVDNNDFIYMSGTSDTKSGIYKFNIEYNSSGEITRVEYTDKSTGITYNSDSNKDIMISGDGKNFTVFSGGARGAAIQGVNPASGQTHTVTLTVKDGKSKSFDEELNKLFDPVTGLTKVLENNYESIIKNIDKRIVRENMRLLQIKNRLEMRFARLEVNMANWNGQMERLQQQIKQLPQGA